MTKIPASHVGQAVAAGPVTLFPVWTDAPGVRAPQTGAAASVAVAELAGGPSLGALVFENLGPNPMLLLEGELLEAAELALRDELPAPASAVVHFMLGLACFELGQNERCERHFARTEHLLASDAGDSPREATFSFAGSATVLQGCSAIGRGGGR